MFCIGNRNNNLDRLTRYNNQSRSPNASKEVLFNRFKELLQLNETPLVRNPKEACRVIEKKTGPVLGDVADEQIEDNNKSNVNQQDIISDQVDKNQQYPFLKVRSLENRPISEDNEKVIQVLANMVKFKYVRKNSWFGSANKEQNDVLTKLETSINKLNSAVENNLKIEIDDIHKLMRNENSEIIKKALPEQFKNFLLELESKNNGAIIGRIFDCLEIEEIEFLRDNGIGKKNIPELNYINRVEKSWQLNPINENNQSQSFPRLIEVNKESLDCNDLELYPKYLKVRDDLNNTQKKISHSYINGIYDKIINQTKNVNQRKILLKKQSDAYIFLLNDRTDNDIYKIQETKLQDIDAITQLSDIENQCSEDAKKVFFDMFKEYRAKIVNSRPSLEDFEDIDAVCFNGELYYKAENDNIELFNIDNEELKNQLKVAKEENLEAILNKNEKNKDYLISKGLKASYHLMDEYKTSDLDGSLVYMILVAMASKKMKVPNNLYQDFVKLIDKEAKLRKTSFTFEFGEYQKDLENQLTIAKIVADSRYYKSDTDITYIGDIFFDRFSLVYAATRNFCSQLKRCANIVDVVNSNTAENSNNGSAVIFIEGNHEEINEDSLLFGKETNSTTYEKEKHRNYLNKEFAKAVIRDKEICTHNGIIIYNTNLNDSAKKADSNFTVNDLAKKVENDFKDGGMLLPPDEDKYNTLFQDINKLVSGIYALTSRGILLLNSDTNEDYAHQIIKFMNDPTAHSSDILESINKRLLEANWSTNFRPKLSELDLTTKDYLKKGYRQYCGHEGEVLLSTALVMQNNSRDRSGTYKYKPAIQGRKRNNPRVLASNNIQTCTTSTTPTSISQVTNIMQGQREERKANGNQSDEFKTETQNLAALVAQTSTTSTLNDTTKINGSPQAQVSESSSTIIQRVATAENGRNLLNSNSLSTKFLNFFRSGDNRRNRPPAVKNDIPNSIKRLNKKGTEIVRKPISREELKLKISEIVKDTIIPVNNEDKEYFRSDNFELAEDILQDINNRCLDWNINFDTYLILIDSEFDKDQTKMNDTIFYDKNSEGEKFYHYLDGAVIPLEFKENIEVGIKNAFLLKISEKKKISCEELADLFSNVEDIVKYQILSKRDFEALSNDRKRNNTVYYEGKNFYHFFNGKIKLVEFKGNIRKEIKDKFIDKVHNGEKIARQEIDNLFCLSPLSELKHAFEKLMGIELDYTETSIYRAAGRKFKVMSKKEFDNIKTDIANYAIYKVNDGDNVEYYEIGSEGKKVINKNTGAKDYRDGELINWAELNQLFDGCTKFEGILKNNMPESPTIRDFALVAAASQRNLNHRTNFKLNLMKSDIGLYGNKYNCYYDADSDSLGTRIDSFEEINTNQGNVNVTYLGPFIENIFLNQAQNLVGQVEYKDKFKVLLDKEISWNKEGENKTAIVATRRLVSSTIEPTVFDVVDDNHQNK